MYMKIAIVSLFGHCECLFFLCELLQEHNITLYISNNTRGEEQYVCKLYSNIDNVIFITDKLNEDVISLYDVIFKLSSNDDVIYHPSVISLLHLSILQNVSNRYISLTPYITGNNISYMLPVFNPIDTRISYNKLITMVGYFLNSWVDEDLRYFIENSKHNFNFIVWGDGNYDNLRKFSNVKLYHNISNEHLIELINDSSYILLRNTSYINYDRFTGMISLALSFKKPLIVDKRTKEAYNIPGIVYEKQYSELVDTLQNDMTISIYESLVNAIDEFNKNIINTNKILMNKILQTSRKSYEFV